jgi:DNA primase
MNVEELLQSKQVPFIPKGKDYVVSCLSPEHDDSNPSMRVDQITGIFHCFSCGYKGNLFVHFGEKASFLHLRRELIKKKIREKRAESVGLPFPRSALPYVGNWRNIKPETYRKFEAFQEHESFIGRIVFPIRDMSGRIVAFNARHMTGGTPKYLISPPGARMPLFPAKIDSIQASVILVEGIYDMLNLHDKGLTNAVCCFGTRNINEEKLSILRLQGIEEAIVFFDGDEAGQTAAIKVQEMCENVDLLTRNINIADIDPGALTENQVEKLKSKLYKGV